MKQVTARVSQNIYDWIKDKAEREERSASFVVRKLIEAGYKQMIDQDISPPGEQPGQKKSYTIEDLQQQDDNDFLADIKKQLDKETVEDAQKELRYKAVVKLKLKYQRSNKKIASILNEYGVRPAKDEKWGGETVRAAFNTAKKFYKKQGIDIESVS